MEKTQERDLSTFDKSVMELFDVCKNILKVSEKRNLSLSNRKNPYLVRLEKYEKTYSKTDPEEHVVYFEKIYSSNKRNILLGPQRDSWLSDGDIIITFGEDCGLKTDMKLHLSGIYSTAVKIREEIKDELESLPNSSDPIETSYPSNFMTVLYRIFQEVTSSDNEKTKLKTHIEGLDSENGIRTKNNSGTDPMASLFDMAAGMAEQVSGNKIPRDKMPGKDDFGKMISSVMDNPKTKSMLGNMMQEFKNTNNIGEIVTKLVGGLSAPSSNGDNAAAVETGNNETGESGENGNLAIENSSNANVNDEFEDY